MLQEPSSLEGKWQEPIKIKRQEPTKFRLAEAEGPVKKEQNNFGLNQNDSHYNQKPLSKKNQRMKTTE